MAPAVAAEMLAWGVWEAGPLQHGQQGLRVLGQLGMVLQEQQRQQQLQHRARHSLFGCLVPLMLQY